MFCTKNGTKFSFWIYCCRRCHCWSPSKNPNLIKYIFAGLGSKQVVLWYLHIRLTLNHFRATRPDSHSTISIITWYLLLKILIFSTIYSHIWLTLNHFCATRSDLNSTIFDTHSDSYSTNLVLVHSLCWMGKILIFTPFNSTTLTNIIWLVYSSTVFYSVPRIFLKVYDSEKKCHLK